MKANQDNIDKINRTYRLYDEVMWIVVLGLLYFTYEAFTNDRVLKFKIASIFNVTLVWIFLLFKTHKIEVHDQNTILFKGVFRKIIVNPQDIILFQDLLRGVRVVCRKRSIILWPFIEKQGEFKALLRNLNPNIQMVDVSNKVVSSNKRLGFLFFGLFVYLGGMIAFLFYQFTH